MNGPAGRRAGMVPAGLLLGGLLLLPGCTTPGDDPCQGYPGGRSLACLGQERARKQAAIDRLRAADDERRALETRQQDLDDRNAGLEQDLRDNRAALAILDRQVTELRDRLRQARAAEAADRQALETLETEIGALGLDIRGAALGDRPDTERLERLRAQKAFLERQLDEALAP